MAAVDDSWFERSLYDLHFNWKCLLSNSPGAQTTSPTTDMRKLYSLVFVREGGRVLLGHKTRGLGRGLWNGFGGKIEAGETILEGALRELKEESNVEAPLEHVGVVTYFEEGKPTEEVVHVFTANEHSGPPLPSEEMSPVTWFDVHHMPYEQMWPDATLWIPLMIEGRCFTVDVTYGCDNIIKSFHKEVFTDRDSFRAKIKSDFRIGSCFMDDV